MSEMDFKLDPEKGQSHDLEEDFQAVGVIPVTHTWSSFVVPNVKIVLIGAEAEYLMCHS